MKNGFKNVFFLFGALAVGFILQFVGAFAVMIPAVAVKELQIISMGLSGTIEETVMLNQLITDLMGPTVFVTHIILVVSFALWYGFGCCKKRELLAPFRKTFTGKNIVIIVMLAAGGCYLTNFAMPLAGMIIPESIMQSYIDLMETAGFGSNIFSTLAAVLIAPFGEELIFRGVCYHYACRLTAGMPNRKAAFYIANTIQALAFGIFHGNLVQGIYAFLLGLLLGYLRERFGSVWASILAHMLVNGISSFLWEPLALILPETVITFLIGSVVCLAVVVLGLRLGGPGVREKAEF